MMQETTFNLLRCDRVEPITGIVDYLLRIMFALAHGFSPDQPSFALLTAHILLCIRVRQEEDPQNALLYL